MSGFRCRFCKGSLMKVHYPKLYNMAHLFTFNAFTDFKGSNNYILFAQHYSYLYEFTLISNFHFNFR